MCETEFYTLALSGPVVDGHGGHNSHSNVTVSRSLYVWTNSMRGSISDPYNASKFM